MRKRSRLEQGKENQRSVERTFEKRKPLLYSLARRFGWRCWYCGLKLNPIGGIHIDHIVPRTLGGSDDESNLALTCPFCNMAKGGFPLEEFMNWLEWLRGDESYTPYNVSQK